MGGGRGYLGDEGRERLGGAAGEDDNLEVHFSRKQRRAAGEGFGVLNLDRTGCGRQARTR